MIENSKTAVGEELKQRIKNILDSDDYRESGAKFFEALSEEMESDCEPWDKKGAYLLRAVADNDVEGIFLALCGWSIPTLLAKAGLGGVKQ